ncbi:AraC family transcriptional regulator [Streptococcus orisasini]
MNVLNAYSEFNSSHFDLNVDHYGAEACDSGYSFGPSVRHNYVLHFIISGCGRFTVDGKTVLLKTGDIFLLPKDKLTFYQADYDDPWTYLWVGFSGSHTESILRQTSLFNHFYCHSSIHSPILKQLLRLIDSNTQPLNTAGELQLISDFYQLLAYLITAFPNPNSSQQTEHYIHQVLKIIHSQYDKPLRVAKIAEKMNLNRSYLYKIFKEETGCSIKDYILQIRMEKSSKLLQNPELNISEISHSVGFSDPLAFSKAFKKYFQTSPSQYRKEHM